MTESRQSPTSCRRADERLPLSATHAEEAQRYAENIQRYGDRLKRL